MAIRSKTISHYKPYLQKYLKGKHSQREIIKEMGLIDRKVFKKIGYHLYGERFKKVCRLQTQKQYDSITHKPTLPTAVDTKFGYFLGVLCGDGYISNNRVGLNVTNSNFAKRFSKYGWDLFKIKSKLFINKIRDETPLIHIMFNSKILYEYIKKIGDFKTKTWIVPQIIERSNDKVKYAFLSGLIDSDGTVSKLKYKNGVSLTTISKEGITSLTRLLNSLGIKSFYFTLLPPKDKNWSIKFDLFIKKTESLKKLENLHLACRYKQKALNRHIINCNKKLKIITKYNQAKILREVKRLTYVDISKILKIPYSLVRSWFYLKRVPRVMLDVTR